MDSKIGTPLERGRKNLSAGTYVLRFAEN